MLYRLISIIWLRSKNSVNLLKNQRSLFMCKKSIVLLLSIIFTCYQLIAQGAGNALSFDGSDDYVKTNNTFALPTSSGTFEGWIWAASGEINNSFWGNTVGEAGKARGLRVNNGSLNDDVYFYGYTCDAVFTDAFVGLYDKWTHVALVINSTTSVSLYLNGKLIETKTLGGTLQAVIDTFLVGDEHNTTAGTFKGKIDKIRVWDDVRTATEIRDNMYKELSNPSGEANLVVYYKFNETSGTTADNAEGTASLDGTLNSFTFPGVTSGAFAGSRNALDFDGVDDYIDCGDNDNFSFGNGTTDNAFTIEAWVKMDDATDFLILSKGEAWTTYEYNFGEATSDKIELTLRDNSVPATIGRSYNTALTSYEGKWTHLSATYDGSGSSSGIRIYLNGQRIDDTNVNSGSYTAMENLGGSLYFGKYKTEFASGLIDEVRIWSTARTVAQIRDNMCKTLVGNESGLVAYYRFDQENATGQTTLYDITSNNNDGTLTSMDATTDWVSSTAFNTWIGSEGTSWATDGNWSREADPVSTDNVGIPDQTNDPTISAAANWNNLVVSENANLTMNYSSGVSPGGKTFVNGTLTMTSGNLTTTSSNLLTVGSSGTISGGSSSSFVNGPLKHTIASTSSTGKTFPIGKGSAYRPITLTITQDAATSTEYTAEVFNSAPTSRTLPGTLDKVSSVRYCNVTKGDGAGVTDATIKINYDSDDGVTDYTNLRIAKDDGSGNWVDLGGTGSANTTGNITSTTNFTSFSDFVLANATDGDNSLPVGLSDFQAIAGNGKVTLKWITESEIDNLGFNIYRSTKYNDQLSMINDQLIPGAGNSSQRHDYEYVDKGLTNGVTYWYKLEDVDYSGNTKLHGPVSAIPMKNVIPSEFRLYPNYPNPFNPVTTIAYDLPEESYVELIVYNIRGERVKTLLKGFQEVGSYQLSWDGRDQNSEILSSGIYFLQISTGKYLKTNKMVFIR